MLATVSNKRLEKAVDVKVNLIGVDKLRVKPVVFQMITTLSLVITVAIYTIST